MRKKSLKKKLLGTVIIVVVIAVVLTTSIKLISDSILRSKTDTLLVSQAKDAASVFVAGQAESINEQIRSVASMVSRTASFTEYIYRNPKEFAYAHNKYVTEFPSTTTGVTFHWAAFSEEDADNEKIIVEADMLSAL